MSAPAAFETAEKRQARLMALAALQGIQLYRLATGRWLACRWGLSREMDDLEVEPWLQQAGWAS